MRTRILLGQGAIAAALSISACGDDPGSGMPGSFSADEPTRVDGGSNPGDDDDDDAASDADDDDDDGNGHAWPIPEDQALTTDQVRAYLKRVAPSVAGRSLSYDETQLIESEGENAIYPIVEAWTLEPGFADAVRFMVGKMLHTSGESGGVDFELPGNLAAEVAGLGLPWSTILTADYCVDATGAHVGCDTGAPNPAGVLGTRAYLKTHKGRYNLSRAKQMVETFSCRVYPMEPTIQIPLDKEILIPMFRAESDEEQEVEEAEGGFGNGIGCYFCHSQFGAHAQLYVKYDDEGLFRADATGLQDMAPMAELGRSPDGLYASHLDDPLDAASEASQMFGEPVLDLRDAAEVLADSRLFTECTVKNLLAHAFDLLAGASDDFAKELILDLADNVEALGDDPTIAQYMLEVFTDDAVIRAVVAPLTEEE